MDPRNLKAWLRANRRFAAGWTLVTALVVVAGLAFAGYRDAVDSSPWAAMLIVWALTTWLAPKILAPAVRG